MAILALGRLGAAGHLDELLPLLKSDTARRAAVIQVVALLKAKDHLPVGDDGGWGRASDDGAAAGGAGIGARSRPGGDAARRMRSHEAIQRCGPDGSGSGGDRC